TSRSMCSSSRQPRLRWWPQGRQSRSRSSSPRFRTRWVLALWQSLARPGGNITGYSDMAAGVAQKRLGLLSEAVPRLSRVGVLRHADNPGSKIASEQLESAARQISLKLYHLDVKHPADLEAGFDTLTKARVQALIVIADLQLAEHAPTIVGLA